MSSISGAQEVGGDNEDVEADASLRTEDARAFLTESGLENNVWATGEDLQELDQNISASAQRVGDHWDTDVDMEQLIDEPVETQDYAQLEYHAALDESESEVDLLSPGIQFDTQSPDSSSVPDDTPSIQGSIASSPLRGASPIPRRTPTRTASGALQPFERRFETRLAASPASSPRTASPAFLAPHSRQISLSSQLSHISSQDDVASEESVQAPWDVIKWTPLRKIGLQALSEAGKRNFGRPTYLAVSALIAVGTSKGLILGFDYHQTLKIIIGQGTTAAECGSVTSLAISADYTTIAAGHANGHIFTWEINKPARPFLRISPLDRRLLQDTQHPDGHVSGSAILHIGFLATRHTALVSADAGGMAFSHLATRGLGPVTRTITTTRLLGRYPELNSSSERKRKQSSVLAFAPLPLGNIEQSTDSMGLTAILTPYLLVIVSTMPVAQTQHKSSRPKDFKPHSTLSGCLAWFPAVKLKHPNPKDKKGTSNNKLAYCWSNILSVMEIRAVEEIEDSEKPPDLQFSIKGRWQAEEAIVAVQWLSRSVLAVLTISQRFLILEDSSLQVTDTIDLMHKHIYHHDMFSQQLHSVVERLDLDDQDLHGVVADAFHMSFKVYKGRTFLLGFDDLTVGTLSNWADRLVALMETGDHIAALRLAVDYYTGSKSNIAVGLPEVAAARHPMVRERIIAMMSASLQYTLSPQDVARRSRLGELAAVCFEACICMHDTAHLFEAIFEIFEDAEEEDTFIETMEPYVLDREVDSLPPDVIKSAVSHFISENQAARLEEMLCRLNPTSFDLDQITIICRQHSLYDALIYAWTRAIGDFVTPLTDLLSLVKILDIEDDIADNPFYESAMKIYPYLAYTLTGRRYPGGEYMGEAEAYQAKGEVYSYLFAGTPAAWPLGSDKILRTMRDLSDEPAFPYLVLLIEFHAANLMSVLNEAFEDSFLNDSGDSVRTDGLSLANSNTAQQGYKMTRQHIVEVLLDIMRQNDLDPEQVTFVYMFIARTLPKYPGQLVLKGSILNNALESLCQPPSDVLRDDCQLSVEYLLSAYRPPNMGMVIGNLRQAHFYRVLKTVFRGEKRYTDLLEAYFEDPNDKSQVFEAIDFCLKRGSGNARQIQALKQSIESHVSDLAEIDVVTAAQTIAVKAPDLLRSAIHKIEDSYEQFIFLRTLLEPGYPQVTGNAFASGVTWADEDAVVFNETYVQLMCRHDPTHVAAYIESLPSGNLELAHVLPAMEESGVVDAAVVLLARDGSAKDAMDRLIAHLQTLEQALVDIIHSASESPELALTKEAVDDLVESLDKYTRVGIWLCQGQSKTAIRQPRPRTNIVWDIPEDDLDLDEYLWLNLVDMTVQISKNTGIALREYKEAQQEERGDDDDVDRDMGLEISATMIRKSVQLVFTSLLAATAAPNLENSEPTTPTKHTTRSSMSFLRVLRTFLTRAVISAPSLADLREVLSDIFSAYAFEHEVLALANQLLGSDVFTDIAHEYELRQRGWRPRTQVCEHCKRRAWGQGTGEAVWSAWVIQEQKLDEDRKRRLVERGGGEEARRLERGKSKERARPDKKLAAAEEEQGDNRRLELVVFACRHVFHRICLDAPYREGKPPGIERYTCPLCITKD